MLEKLGYLTNTYMVMKIGSFYAGMDSGLERFGRFQEDRSSETVEQGNLEFRVSCLEKEEKCKIT